MKISIQLFVSVLCLLLSAGHSHALKSSEAIVFGVVPQQTTDKLLKAWAPTMNHLRQALQRPVRFATAPTISEFELRCQRGEYDVAYMNPYHYITYAKNPGYRVIANQSNKKLHGIVVVPKNSSYKSLHDLNGLTLHFPSPNAFAASLLIQAELRKQHIDVQPHFAGSHDSVYRNVAMNVAHAGGGINRTFHTQTSQIAERLKILGTTKGYTPHAIAVHPRIDADLQESLRQALLELPPAILEPLHFHSLQAASDHDYDDVRALDIDKTVFQ